MRTVALEISSEEFKKIGHRLVDEIAVLFDSLPSRPVTRAETPAVLDRLLPSGSLPEKGRDAESLMAEVTPLLFDHSLFNAHPRFLAYITSPPSPIGVLADFLAAAVNPNLGAAQLSPIATQIELQTVAWIAELIGYPASCGGLLVSGGNMANFVCFLAARKARSGWDVRKEGVAGGGELVLYASVETHTWVQKAADLFGLGTKAIRWIPIDAQQRMNTGILRAEIAKDRSAGRLPFLAVGTAGSVSTGAVDPLPEIAAICRQESLWFHVDGAYGALAAALPDASPDLKALSLADSVAVDPHKWLYAPLEAGCVLVRDRQALVDAFSYRPPYYHFDPEEEATNFFELGPQNSRGFRALKVWLALRQAGRSGYIRMISDDINLARRLFERAEKTRGIEAFTCELSIATFRFVPEGIDPGAKVEEEYLNELNEKLLTRLQQGGEAYLSNAVVGGRFLLRACVVNFRTTGKDIDAIPEIVVRIGRELDLEIRPKELAKD
jgi:glutamate/tyrosine decarboxylase-like PLP-dependent enzyme